MVGYVGIFVSVYLNNLDVYDVIIGGCFVV